MISFYHESVRETCNNLLWWFGMIQMSKWLAQVALLINIDIQIAIDKVKDFRSSNN